MRWVSVAESMAVVGSVGPVRALTGSLRGDSLLLNLRRSDLAVIGALSGAGIEDPPLLRFLLEPWRFGAPGMRGAIARAGVAPEGEGWRFHGGLGEGAAGGGRSFTLRLGSRVEPVSLAVRFGPHDGDTLLVRYGASRRYAAGRLPRWVEWSWGASRARLTIERHVPWRGAGPRTDLRPEPGDSVLTLDEPRGRAVLRDLLGVGATEPDR